MRNRSYSSSLLLSALLVCGGLTAPRALAAGEYDEVPVPVKAVAPTYPSDMKRAGASGIVTIAATINENGDVVERSITKSSRPEFEAAALDAIDRWKFKPARKGGVAVKARVTIPIKFNAET